MALGGRDVLKLIVDADSAGAVKEFDKLGNSIKSSVGDADKQVSGFTKRLGSAFDGLQAHSPKVSGIFDKMGVSSQQAAGMIATALPSAALVAGAAVATFAVKSVGAASALEEQLSKTNAVFGTSADTIVKWAETAASSFGQSKTQALEAASSFGNMFLQLGIGADQATNMSMSMTELASDFASFFNTNPADALDAIASAFRGEYDAVQRFVPTINAAAVEQKALEMGLAATTKELTAQDKALAAYELIMTGAGKATGDFDKTSGSLANSQRILSASVSDLSAELGGKLTPVFGEVVKAAIVVVDWIGKADKAVRDLNEAAGQDKGGGGLLKQLTGIDITWGKDLADVNWDGSKKGADDTAASVRDVALSFKDGKDGVAGFKDAVAQGVGVMSHFGATADSVAQHLDNNVEGMLNLGASADAVAQNIGNETDALLALNDALAANVNATLAAFDSTFALSDSQRAFNDAAIEANSTTEDQQAAFDDAAQAALRVATATVKYAEDQATLRGDTLLANQSQDILIDTLGKLAAQVGGPVADQLNGMIATLRTLDQTNADPDATLNDQASGPIRNLEDRVRNLDGTSASIVVRAATADAAAALDGIISRANRINGMRIVAGVGAGLATGVRNFHGGIALVGEKGPEIVHIPKGADVYTNAESRAMMSVPAPSLPLGGSGVGGRATYITINAGVGDPVAIGRAVKQAIAAAERAGVN